jgi:hypothetical protein
MFLDRYILFTSVGFYLLIAHGLFWFTPVRRLPYFAAGSLLVAMVITTDISPDNCRRVDRVVEVVRELRKKDTNSVVFISPDYTSLEFTYHYSRPYFKDYKNTFSLLSQEGIFPLNDLLSFPPEKYFGKKVIFLDCDAGFAFGKNEVLRALDSSHERITCVPVYKIYSIYWFRPARR